MGRSTGSNGLCAGRASDLRKAQKEPTETSHSHFPYSGLTRTGEYLSGFKNPVAFPIFIDLVPPAEAHHEPSGYILHRPEVKGQKEKHGDKTAHETPAEPVTAHVGDDGTHSEKQVEKGGQRVPGKEPRRPSLRGATWAVSELTSRSAQSISGRGSKEGTKFERLIIISAFCFLPLEESRTFPSFDSKYHLPSLKPGHL